VIGTRKPEVGDRIQGWTKSDRLAQGTYLATDPSGTSYRIALQGAGKVFICAATAEFVTEEREA
jgi:hypothetical protein